MPYIRPDARPKFDAIVDMLIAADPLPGEFNYIVTRLVDGIIRTNRPVTYDILSHLIGGLESIKLELYRRIVAPYEDIKMAKNGDAYSKELPLE